MGKSFYPLSMVSLGPAVREATSCPFLNFRLDFGGPFSLKPVASWGLTAGAASLV